MAPSTEDNLPSSVALAQFPELKDGAGSIDLNERRKKTLEDVDKAKVSYVSSSSFWSMLMSSPHATVGSTFESCSLQEPDSSLMRKFPYSLISCAQALNGSWVLSYDIFAINIAAVMLGYVYGHSERTGAPLCLLFTSCYVDQKLSANQDLGLKVATPVGTVFGQLVFGWLADVYGRKRMCTYCLCYPLSLAAQVLTTP